MFCAVLIRVKMIAELLLSAPPLLPCGCEMAGGSRREAGQGACAAMVDRAGSAAVRRLCHLEMLLRMRDGFPMGKFISNANTAPV